MSRYAFPISFGICGSVNPVSLKAPIKTITSPLIVSLSPSKFFQPSVARNHHLAATVGVEAVSASNHDDDDAVVEDSKPRPSSSNSAIELALQSVVKIFVVLCSPNYFHPWQNKYQIQTHGSGFIITGKRILTNAHVVADHTFVLVRKHGSPTKYRAEVQAVGHECDLAILLVKSEEFWEGMNFLELGDIPFLQEAVAVVGYPQGGDNISVTKGVVSRIESTKYTHGATQLMTIQIDAAINGGNSGGPAIMGNKVAGVAFQGLLGADNIGYIIPVPIIKHFITGVEESGDFVGFCSLGLSFQHTENGQLREHFRMRYDMTGVLVNEINPLSDAHKVLKKDDILLTFDGVPIANDGTVPFRSRERITFDHLVSMKIPNETANVKVLRNGEEHEFNISLRPVLIDDINEGYEHFHQLQVKKVNGVEVENLKQLCRLVESCSEKFLRFDLDDEIVIVLNYQLATIASCRILNRHRIPSAMSIDLLDEAKDSTMGSAGVS
ncbi:protease Do-like 10, mitochondrial isoform X3 [Actinidia eriantha]|uniref:protease Do-like 10, mitochondrial isoform X3 n=1 Tax=Actinidia eriantha TaxID=165200 RepID=UPI0025910D85|nr:protease Do-like 10, mitochondrial isoform X3 [Actinidia eriantha]